MDGSLTHMMEVYRDMIPTLKGYLTKETAIHLPRVEYFIQEIARREALYFQQRAITDKEPDYATEKYKEVYYKVSSRDPVSYEISLIIVDRHVILPSCSILKDLLRYLKRCQLFRINLALNQETRNPYGKLSRHM